MKLINRDTDYAVKALLHIARNGVQRISVAELARELDIPYPFLRKTFQTLSKRGILISSKGKGGGFELALPPEKIHLTDLPKGGSGQSLTCRRRSKGGGLRRSWRGRKASDPRLRL